MSTTPVAVILMGSKADLPHSQAIANGLAEFGIKSVMHIGSAHRTPEHALKLVRQYDAANQAKVFITVAGRSNALSGFTCPQVTAPVIACPPPSDNFAGADVYSSLRMPAGVAPAVILEPLNAALFAAKIFALHDATIAAKVQNYQAQCRDKIYADDATLQATSL